MKKTGRPYKAYWRTGGIGADAYKISRNPKIAVLTYESGRELPLSERFLRSLLRDVETVLSHLPEVSSVRELKNRVEAGFRIPPTLGVAEIGPEEAALLLDGFYDKKIQHVSPADNLDLY